MPITRGQFDYSLNGKGYLLVRPQGGSARSWSRTGIPDVPEHMLAVDIRRGYLDPIINRPDVWNDWSGGFGDAYRNAREPNRYHWSENFDARFPFQLVHCQVPMGVRESYPTGVLYVNPGAGTHVNWFLDVVSVSTMAAASDVLTICLDGTENGAITFQPTGLFTQKQALNMSAHRDSGGAKMGKPAVFGSFAYIPVIDRTLFGQLQYLSGITWATIPAALFTVAGGRLWKAAGPNPAAGDATTLQSCAISADPLVTANWSASLSIGNGQYQITDMIAHQDQLFVGMADGLYAGDQSGTFYNVLSGLARQRHPDNCRDLTIFEGQVIAPHQAGLFAVEMSSFSATRVARVREISPKAWSGRTPLRGRMRAVLGAGPWLYGGWYTGSQSWLMAGNNDPQGRFRWHTLQRLPAVVKVSRLHLDGSSLASGGGTAASGNLSLGQRFWIATDASIDSGGTAPCYWFPIPSQGGNPLADVSFSPNYVGSARMDFGRTDSGVPGIPKAYRQVEVWSENLVGTAGGRWGEIWYSLDGSTFQYLDTAATSPRAQLYFPNNAASLATAQDIELSLRSYTTTPNVTPVYRAVILRSALRPDYIDMIHAQTLIGDNLQDRTGHQLRDGATMLRELRDLARQAAPVVLVDLAGATNWVTVVGPIDEQELWQEGDERPQVAATVKMAVMQFTSGRAA